MIKTPLLLSITMSLLCFSGCAAKNRWFSRKDYKDMQDPFMESDAIADADDSTSGKSSGKARMDSLTADEESERADAAIRRAAGDSEGVARIGRVAPASYPEKSVEEPGDEPKAVRSYSGPALSDFLSRPRTATASAATDAVETQSAAVKSTGSGLSAKTASASDATSRVGRPAASPSPAARVAALPDLSDEANQFDSFLQKKTSDVNSASQQASSAAHETAGAADDFASWATQQKNEWSQKGTDAKAAISQAPAAATQQVQAAAQQARRMADDAIIDFNSSDAEETGEDENAQPLMNRYAAPAEADFEEVKKPTTKAAAVADDFENPFDNPFEEEQFDSPAPKAAPTVKAGTAAKSTSPSRKALDDSFQMDSGWKPSDFTRP